MSIYYVDEKGATKGPVSEKQLKELYENNQIKDSTFIWNGTTIAQWTPLNKVPKLFNQLTQLQKKKTKTTTKTTIIFYRTIIKCIK